MKDEDRRRAAAAHVFVDDLEVPVLSDEDDHHLRRVLRLRPGETVSLADGTGAWRLAAVAEHALVGEGPVEHEPAPVPAVVVGFAVLKGDRNEWVVQKLTELGVDTILPFSCARTVVRWDGKARAARQRRWQQVARGAAMQSRRVRVPEVAPVRSLPEVLGDWPAAVAAEPGGDPPDLRRPVLLVGPEGGWAPEERAQFTSTVGLGDAVLRADTAAVAAGAVLTALRSGLVGPA